MLNYLFIVASPFQLLNSVILAYNFFIVGNNVDIIIYTSLKNYEEYIVFLKKLGYFRNIYINNKNDLSKSNFYYFKLIFLKKSINHFVTKQCYDVVLFSYPSIRIIDQIKYEKIKNDNLHIMMYEDGTGSYTSSVFRSPFLFKCHINKQFNIYHKLIFFVIRILIDNKFQFVPQKMYVYQPFLVQYNSIFPVEKIKLNNDIKNKFKKYFIKELEISNKLTYCVVILDVPRPGNGVEKYAQCFDDVVHILSKQHIPYVVRRHPRTIDARYYANGEKEFSDGLWEVICLFADFQSCVLVSAFSTAALTPCTIAHKYPELIFLNNMTHDSHHNSSANEIYQMALKGYDDNKAKVHAPSSMDELLDIVRSVI